jgi:hypothetical protein
MTMRVAELLRMIRKDPGSKAFILADARDPDMAWGVPSPGPAGGGGGVGGGGGGLRGMPAFREEVRRVLAQGIVDLVLASSSTMQVLAHQERVFDGSTVTPAVRMNDTTDIWLPRGGRYTAHVSMPFASTTFNEAMYGTETPDAGDRPRVMMGLYSVTFNNDTSADLRTLEAFRAFRLEAQRRGFLYILEVFPPNAPAGLKPDEVPAFMNDCIARTLAGVPPAGRPAFLKIPFFGPGPLEELVSYDPGVVVGILGGSGGTTFSSFSMLALARKHGARAALFGRRIKEAEDPLAFIALMRRVVEGDVKPAEAVKEYHDGLRKSGRTPRRTLEQDLQPA